MQIINKYNVLGRNSFPVLRLHIGYSATQLDQASRASLRLYLPALSTVKLQLERVSWPIEK
jgi:hypothetical protein